MLVLTRERDEKIILDFTAWGLGLVEIVQVEIRGHKSRLGVQADPRIPVFRNEVFDAIVANGKPVVSHASHTVVEEIPSPRFRETYCSQCGQSFGPGDHGYSHCEDHRRDESAASTLHQARTDYAHALANDLEAAGEVYSAGIVRQLIEQRDRLRSCVEAVIAECEDTFFDIADMSAEWKQIHADCKAALADTATVKGDSTP